MEKLVVMNYNTLSVHVYNVDPEADIDEEYISNLGHHTSECSWMFGENIDIVHHKGILK